MRNRLFDGRDHARNICHRFANFVDLFFASQVRTLIQIDDQFTGVHAFGMFVEFRSSGSSTDSDNIRHLHQSLLTACGNTV
jgi:hypothetical protein